MIIHQPKPEPFLFRFEGYSHCEFAVLTVEAHNFNEAVTLLKANSPDLHPISVMRVPKGVPFTSTTARRLVTRHNKRPLPINLWQ